MVKNNSVTFRFHPSAFILIILSAFFLRVWNLSQTPPGLWYDEAYNVMDAVWTLDTGHFPWFFEGNNGREPMWHILLMAATSLLGRTTFTVRWVGAVVGLLTIPVMYRFARLLLASFATSRRDARWLALAAAGWLAVSWWHLLNSRAGFRPVLLPPLLMLSLYFFWRGVQNRAPWFQFIFSGMFLGLVQYTYLPARLAPLIFVALVLLWSLLARRLSFSRRRLWLGLLLTGLTSAAVFAPLGLYFLQNPDSFGARTGDVGFSPQSLTELAAHLGQAVMLFLGAGHELYRHHLPGRAMLGWLEIPFFWLGLICLFRPSNLRRPETHLVLLGLAVMWLPALLASPPVHSLRPIGLLPFYYLIVTLGLYSLAQATSRFARRRHHLDPAAATRLFPITIAIFVGFNGLLNTYDYFIRWANHPDVYREYNGSLADLTTYFLQVSRQQDVIIPFHLYVHPTVRYLLSATFPEQTSSAPAWSRPVQMLLIPNKFELLFVGNIPDSGAVVRLTRDTSGQGAAYISRPARAAEQSAIDQLLVELQPRLEPFRDRLGRTVALLAPLPLPPAVLTPLFDPTPLRTIDLTWSNQVSLTGYDVTPVLNRPGQPVMLNFYWRSLTEKTFDYRLFLQLIDAAGNPVNQWEGTTFNEDMYRWRPDGLLPAQHTLWLGPDTQPGPYLVRLGFFDDTSGERLPLQIGQTAADQVQLGLFYVTADDADPRQPATPLDATFGDSLRLTGVTLPEIYHSSLVTRHSSLSVTFHWQALHPTDRPYTVFLQLLNEAGDVVSGWDSQPFNGLYPTDLWSPGELVTDTFALPLPDGGLPPGDYRLITGFYDVDTGARLPVAIARGDGDFTELARFSVE